MLLTNKHDLVNTRYTYIQNGECTGICLLTLLAHQLLVLLSYRMLTQDVTNQRKATTVLRSACKKQNKKTLNMWKTELATDQCYIAVGTMLISFIIAFLCFHIAYNSLIFKECDTLLWLFRLAWSKRFFPDICGPTCSYWWQDLPKKYALVRR